ncbi:MAG: tyrosine-type recombinase/integrase [Candidatus Moraniibacteriota bacterium]
MKEYINQFTSYLQERNLSFNTIKVYNDNLKEFDEFIGRSNSIRRIGRKEIKSFLSFLSEKGNQPITRRAKLIAIRSFFKYLEDENLIKINPTNNLPLPKVATKEPTYLLEGEIKKILKLAKKDKNKRAEIAIRIFSETGIRLSELVNISVGDIDTKSKTIRIKRKGDTEQTIPLNNNLIKLLKCFIKNKNSLMPLIVNKRGGRMTARRVAIMVKGYFKIAKVDRVGISVHSIRHSFCSRLLEKGVNLKTIQILAGHKNISTTERYLHISDIKIRKEVRLAEIY